MDTNSKKFKRETGWGIIILVLASALVPPVISYYFFPDDLNAVCPIGGYCFGVLAGWIIRSILAGDD